MGSSNDNGSRCGGRDAGGISSGGAVWRGHEIDGGGEEGKGERRGLD